MLLCMLEVMRCVLLCMLEAVDGGLCLLEVAGRAGDDALRARYYSFCWRLRVEVLEIQLWQFSRYNPPPKRFVE